MPVLCAVKAMVATAKPQATQSRPGTQGKPANNLRERDVRTTSAGLLAALAVLTVSPADVQATGLERIDVPMPSGITSEGRDRNQAVINSADDAFQNSELLRSLKERTELNRDQRKRELQDRYCRRQAELGVGDCAGLRLIPGATKSGVQKRPEWLDNWAKAVLGDQVVDAESVDAE